LVRNEEADLFSLCRLFVVRLVAPSLTASEQTQTPYLVLLDKRRLKGQQHCPLALLALGWAECSVATALALPAATLEQLASLKVR
jgi:hypothetical protein